MPSPANIAVASAVAGIGLAVAGVYLLAGLGWALLVAAAPPLLLAAVLMRGLLRVG